MFRNLYLAVVRNKQHFSFLLALIVSFLLLSSKNAPGIIFTRELSIDFYAWISTPISNLKALRAVEEENSILRAKNMQYSLQFQDLQSLETENRQLRSMLDFKNQKQLTMIAGHIVSKGTEPGLESMLIDVGSLNGIQVDNPVITPSGLIGKTIIVGKTSSIVQLISDVNFRISVRILPSGTTGILRWSGDEHCEIREVHANSKVNIGNQIVTSGYSNIYPPNLNVGVVTEITHKRGNFQKLVKGSLSSELGSLMNVFVVIDG